MAENQRRENHRVSPEIQTFLTYFIKKMHDICMLLDARVILEWALHFLNLTVENGPNESRCTSGTHARDFDGEPSLKFQYSVYERKFLSKFSVVQNTEY